jgi:cell wall-associated NlpC family hydrolase
MTKERMEYSEARSMMKPGDVIAFGGKGHFSELIKFATRADVSHVGVVLQTRVADDDSGRFFN